jgi:hypothetical protein
MFRFSRFFSSDAKAFVGPCLSFCALILGLVGTFACEFFSVAVPDIDGSFGIGIWN